MTEHHSHNISDAFFRCYGCGVSVGDPRLDKPCPTPDFVGQSHIKRSFTVEDKDIPFAEPHPWEPITNKTDLKHLGKLAEECCELGSAISRAIIQGIDECEPDTKKVNRKWIEDEIADVHANTFLVIERFQLDWWRIEDRKNKKIAKLRAWHTMHSEE